MVNGVPRPAGGAAPGAGPGTPADRAARPGRPRDEEIDARILAATLDLLHSGGYGALRVQAVAQAAGVPKSTIYRRWPSLAELAVAAVERAVDHPRITPTDDPATDLARLVVAVHETVLDTGLADFLPRVGMDIAAQPEAAGRYRERLVEPLRGAAVDAVRRGLATGAWPTLASAASAAGAADDIVADRVVNLLIGGALYEATILGRVGSVDATLDAATLLLGRPLPRPA